MEVTKTLFVATDSDDLGHAQDIYTFEDTAQDALDAWLEVYTDHPRYIFNIRVIQRAKVWAHKTTIDWGSNNPD